MPKVIKKKAAKHEARAEDSVRTFLSGSAEWAEANFRYIVMAVIAVLVALLAAGGFFLARSSAEKKARDAFYEGYKLYYGLYDAEVMTRGERFEKAIESFRKSYDARRSPQALMYMANSQYAMGRHDEALASLDELLQRFPQHEIYSPLALYKAAMVELKLEKPEEALKYLDRLDSSAGDMYKDLALAEAASILEGLGREEEAAEKYKAIVERFPDSPFAGEARLKTEKEEKGEEPKKAREGG